MTDLKELKAKAECCPVLPITSRDDLNRLNAFHEATNPSVVLKLIARIEKAEAALRFYADRESWNISESRGHALVIQKSDTDEFEFGGRRAREYFKEGAK